MPKPSVLHSGQECGHVEAACAVSGEVRDARAHAGEYGRGIPSQPSRRYLLDTVCLDQGDAEVDNTQGAINDDDMINIMIRVRMRLALYCCGWCCRDALVEGKGEREGAGWGACTCATSVHVRDKRGNTKTDRERRTVWTGTTQECSPALTCYECSVTGLGATPCRQHQGHAGEGGQGPTWRGSLVVGR